MQRQARKPRTFGSDRPVSHHHFGTQGFTSRVGNPRHGGIETIERMQKFRQRLARAESHCIL
jgi:hypothetical protein